MHPTSILVALAIIASSEARLYLTNSNGTEVCIFTQTTCGVVLDSNEIAELMKTDPDDFVIVGDDEFIGIKASCLLSSRFGNDQYGFIYPGTLWCGRGTKATNYTELGVHSKEDACCRDHDNCPTSMVGGECKGGVCNPSRFTRSHCDCDRQFQECLRNSGTETGNTIGAIFFNIAQIFCVREMPSCPESAKIAIDESSPRQLSCPFEFLPSAKYIFSAPYYTVKNRKAYYLNLILRKLNLGRK